jgi:hypothetical protein
VDVEEAEAGNSSPPLLLLALLPPLLNVRHRPQAREGRWRWRSLLALGLLPSRLRTSQPQWRRGGACARTSRLTLAWGWLQLLLLRPPISGLLRPCQPQHHRSQGSALASFGSSGRASGISCSPHPGPPWVPQPPAARFHERACSWPVQWRPWGVSLLLGHGGQGGGGRRDAFRALCLVPSGRRLICSASARTSVSNASQVLHALDAHAPLGSFSQTLVALLLTLGLSRPCAGLWL